MKPVIKIALSILLFLCLLKMPYGYYQLVRFTAMAAFAFLALEAGSRKQYTELFIYVMLAILFQPVYKIALGRTIWNGVDVVVGMGLLISLISDRKRE